MATATETNAQLTRALKDLGLTKKDFTQAQKAYDTLKGTQRIKADKQAWLNFGAFASQAKSHLASEKTNLNSGIFGEFVKTYFPLMNSQDVSNAIWLFTNQSAIDKATKGKTLSNPASIKAAIRKDLKANESATAEDFKAVGLKSPVDKGPVVKKTAAEKATAEAKSVSMEKLTIDQILAFMNHATEVLEQRTHNNPKQYKETQAHEIDNLSYRLSDVAVSIHTVKGTIPAEPKKAKTA
jgi:hypothetical protein